MAKSNKNARRELAIKKAKRIKVLITLAVILVIAGLITAIVFAVDWETWNTPPVQDHSAPGCCPP